jgi:hypothetical protein
MIRLDMTTVFAILAIIAALMFLLHVLTRNREQGQQWLREEGYLPPTPEEARQAQREKLYGKFRQDG